MLRRLEDRIRELCARAIIARGHELEVTLEELKVALREHTERLRKAAIGKFLRAGADPSERRMH
ncbi:MAG TPA: hypothetical protein VMD76_13070 [Candidatus Sulfotelmatobacter sp.]|nr:hypothetical protein [Candidatus Sulfotelmatobacter sp.]